MRTPRKDLGRLSPDERVALALLTKLGRPDREVARLTGLGLDHVGRLRLAAGLDRKQQKERALVAACAAVRAGASRADAAREHGVSYACLVTRLVRSGVRAAGQRATSRAGAVVAAVDLATRLGLKPSEAARRAGCTPGAVRAALVKLRAERKVPERRGREG